eukprot:4023457-Amphidinium_carterae.1
MAEDSLSICLTRSEGGVGGFPPFKNICTACSMEWNVTKHSGVVAAIQYEATGLLKGEIIGSSTIFDTICTERATGVCSI